MNKVYFYLFTLHIMGRVYSPFYCLKTKPTNQYYTLSTHEERLKVETWFTTV